MSLFDFVFGKSAYTEAREKAERFFLAGKIGWDEYSKAIEDINREEEIDRWT